ncbi:YbhN family protein [Chloroflexota bacterium]
MEFKHLSKQMISIILLLGFAIWGLVYIKEHQADFRVLSNITITLVTLLFALAILKLIILGLFTKIIVGSLGINLDTMEWFGLSVVSAMGNYLSPFRGGAALRGAYLNTKRGLSISHFLSTLAIFYLISFFTISLIGVIAIAVLWSKDITGAKPILLFLVLCLISPFFVIVMAKKFPQLPGKWAKYVNKVIEGWQLITTQPRTLISLFFITLLNIGISLLLIHYSFIALGQKVPLLNSLIASTLFLISAMIPITPAGLGIAEFALVISSSTLGVEGTICILAAGLNRIVIASTSILLGPIFSYYLSKRTPINQT